MALYADGDPDRARPEYYQEPEHLEDLFASVAAIPFTVRISFSDSDWSEMTEMTMQLAAPTFSSHHGIKHPLEKLVRFKTETLHWPPCEIASTRFDSGVGMTVAPTGAVPVFRALIEIMDQAPTARRGETPETVRVTRRCVCALRGLDDTRVYTLEQNAGLEVVSRLMMVPKSSYLHVLAAWRSDAVISLLGFCSIPGEEVTDFRKFFRKEVEMSDPLFATDPAAIVPEETPLRIASAASAASASSGRQSWSHRTPLRLFMEDDSPDAVHTTGGSLAVPSPQAGK